MKVKVPAKTVEVCDFCNGEGFLQKCLCCSKQYCLTCDGTIGGCWVSPDVCKSCADLDSVRKVVANYADQITPIVKRRDAALRKLKP